MSTRFVFIALVSAVLVSSCSTLHSASCPTEVPCRTVGKEVGPLLIEARALADAGNYQEALAKLQEADAVKSMPDDTRVINEMRGYMNFKMASSASSSPSRP